MSQGVCASAVGFFLWVSIPCNGIEPATLVSLAPSSHQLSSPVSKFQWKFKVTEIKLPFSILSSEERVNYLDCRGCPNKNISTSQFFGTVCTSRWMWKTSKQDELPGVSYKILLKRNLIAEMTCWEKSDFKHKIINLFTSHYLTKTHSNKRRGHKL